MIAGLNAAFSATGKKAPILDDRTVIGALISHITDCSINNFQPMNANFGILRGPEEYIRDKKKRKLYIFERSEVVIREYRDKVFKSF
jgi:methylenetetrahydrofolate--tRNA-(uracil-5-)-methyltransferase